MPASPLVVAPALTKVAPARRRPLVLLAVALLLAAGLSGVAVRWAPQAGAIAPASSAHPYSDPLWWPMRVPVTMDCFQRNPGCRTPHKYWMMDVVPSGQARSISRAGVYAMGAGVVHIGDANGVKCGKVDSYGTWIWIDHGAGVLSRYGHLSRITVKAGQYVAAGQQIGVVGTTGKRVNCHISYVNFSLQRNGLKTSNGYEFRTLKACAASTGATQSWPTAFSRASRWEALRQGSAIPAASDRCMPRTAPATPATPVAKVTAGSGSLRVSWNRPAAAAKVNAIKIEIPEWHPSRGGYWDLPRNSRWVSPSPKATSVLVTKLTKNRLHKVRVYFHNAAGWSRGTAFKAIKTKR